MKFHDKAISSFLLLVLLLLFCRIDVRAQSEDNKAVLDSSEIRSFQDQAYYYYNMYIESILNILDKDLSREDRYRSRSVLVDLFQTVSKKYISDIVDSEEIDHYNPSEYGFLLLSIDTDLPIYYKKYKFSDGFSPIDSISGKLNKELNTFNHVYTFKKYVVERLINSKHIDKSLLNDDSFNAYKDDLLKSIEFRIDRKLNDDYALSLQNIRIIRDNNISYKGKKDEILGSEYDWSDKAEEDYANSIKQEAEVNGITLLPNVDDFVNIYVDTLELASLSNVDTTTFQQPTKFDYLIPGFGHMKFGKTKTERIVKTSIYSGIFITSASFAIYSKFQSDKYYNQHLDAETFRLSRSGLDRARFHNKRFLYSSGVAIVTLAASALHLNISYKIQLKRMKEAGYKHEPIHFGIKTSFTPSNLVSINLNF